MANHPFYIIFIIIVAAGATFFWRLLGTIFGQRFHPDHTLIRWVSSIAYSTVTALSLKLMLFPEGLLSETSINYRISVLAISVGIFYLMRKNVFLACLTGVILFGTMLYLV